MLADLDHESSLDPALAGSKSAQLAVARRSGLPVLPGFVVTAPTSRRHLRLGAEALPERGSGGARLVVSGQPIEFADALVEAGEELAPELVARSSTLLERSGEWAGAFTSYLDLSPEDLPKAVAGCWASAFSVDALGRQEAAGIAPGSFDMAVLIQPVIQPRWGGTADLANDGTAVVHAIEGSPAPLLQGWQPGRSATRPTTGSWEGELVGEVGSLLLDDIAAVLLEATTILGANRCEWAVDDNQLWLLQLGRVVESQPETGWAPNVVGDREDWLSIVRSLLDAPGALGAELVLPWAIGSGVPAAPARHDVGPGEVEMARRLSGELVSQVWALPPEDAEKAARECLDALLGPRPGQALQTISGLREPDPELSQELMSLVHGLRNAVTGDGAGASPDAAWYLSAGRLRAVLGGGASGGSRVGSGRWEPLITAIVLTHGNRLTGAAASPGLGAGLLHSIDASGGLRTPPPRSVLHSEQAAPVLSQLLWDSSGVVTHRGSPAAHLFESARSLGVPAVTGVDLPRNEKLVVAVDGFAGVVATLTVGE